MFRSRSVLQRCWLWAGFSWQVQQPNNISPGSSNPGPSSSNVNISNGNGFSMHDWIKLNFLKGATSNMLNRMGNYALRTDYTIIGGKASPPFPSFSPPNLYIIFDEKSK
jgi:hypothetical protein